MATHDYDLANAAGLAFRGDLNNVLAAIISQNSSLTAPTTTVAYMFWADTTTAILKQRNSLNTAWNSLFNMTTMQWLASTANVTVVDAAADTTTWPMLARSQTGDQVPTTDAGLTYDASTNILGASISGNAATATNATNATNVTGSAVITGAITSSSPTAGIGYATGAGASVTQTGSVSATVTLNSISGEINTLLAGASIPAHGNTNFIFNNNTIGSNDLVIASIDATGNGPIVVNTLRNGAGSVYFVIHNLDTTATIARQYVIRYLVLKVAIS